jgi:RimJ/RimL family protein N-acetyltransferase
MTMTEQSNNNNHFPPVPQVVISERLIIRPTKRADAPYLQQWWNDPAVMEPVGNVDGMQYDEAEMEKWFQRHIDNRPDSRHFIIGLREQAEKPIGEFYIACDDRPGCVSFSLLIGETALWGNGYAREALEAYAEALFATGTCGAMRVDIRRDNDRALHAIDGLGFAVEQVWANGLFQTMILTQAAFEYQRVKAEYK